MICPWLDAWIDSTMRILMLGAGAVGGYFGGRLLQAGRDVTFMVRPARAAALASDGLRIRSRFGDVRLAAPPTLMPGGSGAPFDVAILSCKAYDLEDAMDSIGPAIGDRGTILPLLNGMRHLDLLDRRFGCARVLGGQCVIGATVRADGTIDHLNDAHAIRFGERDGARSDRAQAILQAMSDAVFDVRLSDRIVPEMWEKWVFLATLAGATCLMRATVGQILQAPGGGEFITELLQECARVARDAGVGPRESFLQRTGAMLMTAGSGQTASMLRDIERNAPIESEHIIGDLIRRSPPGAGALPLLNLAYTHLKAYEARRAGLATPTH
jgi:2-dehydropantoate 2-reductase